MNLELKLKRQQEELMYLRKKNRKLSRELEPTRELNKNLSIEIIKLKKENELLRKWRGNLADYLRRKA